MSSKTQGWHMMDFKYENNKYTNIIVGNIYADDLVVNMVDI